MHNGGVVVSKYKMVNNATHTHTHTHTPRQLASSGVPPTKPTTQPSPTIRQPLPLHNPAILVMGTNLMDKFVDVREHCLRNKISCEVLLGRQI